MAQTIERLPVVKTRTGLSRSSIYKQVAAGDFPRPIRLGPRAVGWLTTEIDEWITARMKSRENESVARNAAVGHAITPSNRRDKRGLDLVTRSPKGAY